MRASTLAQWSFQALATAATILAFAACRSQQIVAPVVDYRGGDVTVICIHEFDDRSPDTGEPKVYYNPNHEGAQRAKRQHASQSPGARFAYAVAHNVAIRLNESEDELSAHGCPTPKVIAITRADPGGVVATGSSFGSAFLTHSGPLPPASVEVWGTIRYDVDRDLLGELLHGYGYLYPYDRFEATADVHITCSEGHQRHFLGFVNSADLSNLGLPRLSADPRGQLIARISDMLAPHAMTLDPPGCPLAFVREVVDDETIVVDVGLERRRLTVTQVLDIDDEREGQPTAANLEALLLHRYVRVCFSGGPEAPARQLWRRILVAESST